MSEKKIKQFRKELRDKYNSIEYPDMPFTEVWKRIKKGMKKGEVIKK